MVRGSIPSFPPNQKSHIFGCGFFIVCDFCINYCSILFNEHALIQMMYKECIKIGVNMFEQTFKNIDDILHKDAGGTSELDYTEQTS
jgi:hypothetical protein